MKTRVNWNALRTKVVELPWQSIYGSDDPVDVLNHHLSRLLDFYVPKVTIRKQHGDKPGFDETCRAAFKRKQTAYNHLQHARSDVNHKLFRASQRDANSVYDEARRVYKSRCRDKLEQAANSRTWWCTLKESVFGTESSILGVF